MQSTAETVARFILSKPRFSLLAPISSSCSAGKTWSLSLGFPWRVTSEVGRAVHLLWLVSAVARAVAGRPLLAMRR